MPDLTYATEAFRRAANLLSKDVLYTSEKLPFQDISSLMMVVRQDYQALMIAYQELEKAIAHKKADEMRKYRSQQIPPGYPWK